MNEAPKRNPTSASTVAIANACGQTASARKGEQCQKWLADQKKVAGWLPSVERKVLMVNAMLVLRCHIKSVGIRNGPHEPVAAPSPSPRTWSYV